MAWGWFTLGVVATVVTGLFAAAFADARNGVKRCM